MKNLKFLFIATILVVSGCKSRSGDYDASGVFEATEVVVSAKGNGEIVRLAIELGDVVDVGTPVGCIDTTQLHLRRSQLVASKKAVGSRHTNVDNQLAALQKQIQTLKAEKARFENLVRSNAGTQKQVDDIASQLAVAERQAAAQRELLSSSNSGISSEREGIDIQIAQIEDQIKNSIIQSPINGTILSKYAQQGEFAVQGRALFKVADIENMNLRVYITADQLTALKIGQQVRVYADQGASDSKEYSGVIVWISDKAEFTPKTIQTRDERANLVYAVKVAVRSDGYIKRGMYGDIKIE